VHLRKALLGELALKTVKLQCLYSYDILVQRILSERPYYWTLPPLITDEAIGGKRSSW
jgi:hypothetical protein